ARLAERFHTLLLRLLSQLGGRRLLEDHVAQRLADRHDFIDRHATPHAGAVAGRAARAAIERRRAAVLRHGAVPNEGRLLALHPLTALLADPWAEPLSEHHQQRRREEERWNTHVDESRDRRGAVVGVQRREHEVAGEGRADGDLRSLEVSRLAD